MPRLRLLCALAFVVLCGLEVPVWAETEPAAPSARHSFAYFDHLYSGILALHREEPTKARDHFREVCAAEFGSAPSEAACQKIDRVIASVVESAQAELDLGKIARETLVLKYILISELLVRSAAASDTGTLRALDLLLERDLTGEVWNLPEQMVLLIRAYRLQASGVLRADDPGARVRATSGLRAVVAMKEERYRWWDDCLKVPRFLYQLKEYQEAEPLYRELLRYLPYAVDLPTALLDVGKREVMRKDYEAASKTFGRICGDFPDYVLVHKAQKYGKYCLKKLRARSGSPWP